MKKENQFFLNIIKEYIKNEPSTIQDGIDWNTIFGYSKAHQLTAIVYHQCKSVIPEEYFPYFDMAAKATLYSNVKRKKLAEDTLTLLRKHGIKCFIVKGFEIAEYYPTPMYRTMGDTDIVVENMDEADAILGKNSFCAIAKRNNKEFQYIKDGMEFELHNRLSYKDVINTEMSRVTGREN